MQEATPRLPDLEPVLQWYKRGQSAWFLAVCSKVPLR